MQAVVPSSVTSIDFAWHQQMPRNEAGRMFEERNSGLYYMYDGGDVDNLSENSDDAEDITNRLKWIGYKTKFFSSVIVAAGNFASAELDSKVLKDNPSSLKRPHHPRHPRLFAVAGAAGDFHPLLRPQLLSAAERPPGEHSPRHRPPPHQAHPARLGLFRWINTWIVIPVFDILGQWISNYGVIILLLTIFIKIILFPSPTRAISRRPRCACWLLRSRRSTTSIPATKTP